MVDRTGICISREVTASYGIPIELNRHAHFDQLTQSRSGIVRHDLNQSSIVDAIATFDAIARVCPNRIGRTRTPSWNIETNDMLRLLSDLVSDTHLGSSSQRGHGSHSTRKEKRPV